MTNEKQGGHVGSARNNCYAGSQHLLENWLISGKNNMQYTYGSPKPVAVLSDWVLCRSRCNRLCSWLCLAPSAILIEKMEALPGIEWTISLCGLCLRVQLYKPISRMKLPLGTHLTALPLLKRLDWSWYLTSHWLFWNLLQSQYLSGTQRRWAGWKRLRRRESMSIRYL